MFHKKRSQKTGLPPGSVVYVGKNQDAHNVAIKVFDYNEKQVRELALTTAEECYPYRDSTETSWIHVIGVHDADLIEKLGTFYGLHPLVQEDIANTKQRPKVEDYQGYLFIVLKMLHLSEKGDIDVEQVSMILGPRYLFTFQENESHVFDALHERIRTNKGRIRRSGPDYLAYSVIDAVVDHYFSVLEQLADRIERMENAVVSNPTTEQLEDINHLKRDLIFARRSIWPMREMLSTLVRNEVPHVRKELHPYFRDVYDHAVQVMDTVESFKETVSELHEVYHTSVSNKLNEVLKVLTIMSTVFIPLSFLASVYGMNFDFMPELHLTWGYPALWAMMIFIGASMFLYFHLKKWI